METHSLLEYKQAGFPKGSTYKGPKISTIKNTTRTAIPVLSMFDYPEFPTSVGLEAKQPIARREHYRPQGSPVWKIFVEDHPASEGVYSVR